MYDTVLLTILGGSSAYVFCWNVPLSCNMYLLITGN